MVLPEGLHRINYSLTEVTRMRRLIFSQLSNSSVLLLQVIYYPLNDLRIRISITVIAFHTVKHRIGKVIRHTFLRISYITGMHYFFTLLH